MFPIRETEVIGKNKTPVKLPQKNDSTPTSTESIRAELEFLELEQALASCKKNKKPGPSPLNSICTLLENTTLRASASENVEKINVIKDVLSIVQEDQRQWSAFKQTFVVYQEEHDRNMEKISQLLEQLTENKENVNRKSLSQTVKTKFIVSPAVQKVDLRKSTLNKNLSKNFGNDSPKSDCTGLCTPKHGRPNLSVTQHSVTRSLTRRIHKQWLSLQDTPKPNA